jgi:hypothetical protein
MKSPLKQFLFLLASTLILMLAAIYNKYPIVFADTGTYISSGFSLTYPSDRPITYGLFLKEFSINGYSLWLPIFVQSLMYSFTILLTIKLILGESFSYWKTFAILIFLSIFSSASWVTSMIMADVFTPMGILIGTVILYGKEKKGTQVLLYLMFLFATASHFSHLLIFSMLFMIVLVFKKWLLPERTYPKRYRRAMALVVIAISSYPIMAPSLNKGKSIAFMGVLTSRGIAQEYLKEYCGSKHYKLCAYLDSLDPPNGGFCWGHSPLYKLGGWTDSMEAECADIVHGTLTKPKYIWLNIQAASKYSWIQLYSFKTGRGNGAYMTDWPVLSNIRYYTPRDLNRYVSSRQNTNTLLDYYYNQWNYILSMVIYVSLGLLTLFFIIRRRIYRGVFGHATILFLMGILINAFDCGTFSEVNLRYGSRVIWFIPFLACLSIFLFFRKETPKQNANT